MADLIERIERAGKPIDPAWDGVTIERTLQGVYRKRRRKTVRRALQATALAGLVAIALVRLGSLAPTPAAPLAVAPPGTLQLRDGSRATPVQPGTQLAAVHETSHQVVVDLARGHGRFEVVRNPQRTFAVRAGDVTVTVLGTVFTVERVADRIGVVVEQGSVHVAWGGGQRQLTTGESGWFPPLGTAGSAPVATPNVSAPVAPVAPVAPTAPTAPVEQRRASPVAKESPEAILAAADVARRTGRHAEAVAMLERIVQHHAADPRAPLAAFTLGRVLLTEVGRPAEAATAFARARALAPAGPLAEHALAREVEAWSRAGRPDRARERADEYARQYPTGRRLDAIQPSSGPE